MYDSLELNNFRGFCKYELRNLSRINLLVGKNNVGKTTILEALEILSHGGSPRSLQQSPRRRNEFSSDSEESSARGGYDIRYLFHQHSIYEGVSFEIQAKRLSSSMLVKCEVHKIANNVETSEPFADDDESDVWYDLWIRGTDNELGNKVRISATGILLGEVRGRPLPPTQTPKVSTLFLGTEGADSILLQRMWDAIVLTPEEEKVIAALQIIAPDVERLAFTSRDIRSRPIAWIKLKDKDERIPLGSLGDGTRRLLSLAIYAARASGGILLIDEIDTGLHYSTLQMMWEFIIEAATRLDIQVFATTHSGDCLRALAWLNEEKLSHENIVSVYRVDQSSSQATRYTVDEIEMAVRHQIEVRG